MVGYEPDFNQPEDAKLVWSEFLMGYVKERSFIRHCNTLKVEGSQLTRPYHLHRPEDDDYDSRLATPLVQVFSVCICSNFDDGKPCEIYGSVRALEGPDHRFDLYNRNSEDPETIWGKGSLSLIGPLGGPIIPSMCTTLDLYLEDRIRGVVVVDGQLSLDPLSEDSYDRLIKGEVRGAHGFAYVYYVVFQSALYGTVQVTVTKNDSNFASSIYGTVVAAYENGRGYCSGDEEVKLLETRLLDKPPHQPLCVMVGTPIGLSRDVLVVPAYSSITLELNLWDSNGKIAGGCLQFQAYSRKETTKYISTQFARVGVLVRWHHAFFYLYKDRFMQGFNRRESNNELMGQKRWPLHYQHQTVFFISRELPPVYSGTFRVEVFTVLVSGINQKISALCGAIIVEDGGDRFTIYNRDDSSAELLPDNSLASIEVNYRAIDNCEFGLILFLMDPVDNLEVSRGSFGWNACSIDSYMPWYNKFLCSVVRGDHGYAAVHYEIFRDAIEAHVKVKLFGGHPDTAVSLYGSMSGLYGGYDYSTSYHRKYYTSRLFDKARDKSVQLKPGNEIALLKSIVAVPVDSSLIIEAKLGARAFGINNVDDFIREKREFEIIMGSTISKTIHGDHYWIEVDVEFMRYTTYKYNS